MREIKRKFIDIVTKFGGWILLFFLIPYLYRWFQNFKLSMVEEDKRAEIEYYEHLKNDPLLQDELLHKEVGPTYTRIARELYHHLGYAYSWYDPRRWTENDEEIFRLLKGYSPIPKGIIQAYYVLSAGRDLRADLMALLDKKYYSQLRF